MIDPDDFGARVSARGIRDLDEVARLKIIDTRIAPVDEQPHVCFRRRQRNQVRVSGMVDGQVRRCPVSSRG